MNSIAFIDTEIEPKSRKILDIGCIKGDGSSFHKTSVAEFMLFLNGTQFICGHNIFNHDLKYIGKALDDAGINPGNIIDTLFLSPLLFPTRPYHALLKDDKLQSEEANNPLNDAIKAKDLFNDEIAAFKQTDNGKIKLVRYQSSNLITPLVHDILTTGLTGTTCVLTKTNEEALQITGLLLKNEMQAKLIQTNDSFNLYNLLEVRFFLTHLNFADDVFIISDEVWKNAKQELINKFRNSTKLEVCKNIIRDFEATNPNKKYKSDLEVFIRESKLEDFFNENGETIFVSTIHKAKGKEFDHVFLMLENINPATDEAKRQLYVAMTRAKQNLTIHLNLNFLDNINVDNLEHVQDNAIYPPPKELVINATHEHVKLGYFEFVQHRIERILSGDSLIVKKDGCSNSKGDLVLKFSKKMLEAIIIQEKNGFELKSAKVNFIVYWLKEGAKQEVKIILPELYFERSIEE